MAAGNNNEIEKKLWNAASPKTFPKKPKVKAGTDKGRRHKDPR